MTPEGMDWISTVYGEGHEGRVLPYHHHVWTLKHRSVLQSLLSQAHNSLAALFLKFANFPSSPFILGP
jgi:hypothetical protein